MNLIRNSSIALYAGVASAKLSLVRKLARNPVGTMMVLMGLALTATPLGAHAAGLADLMQDWGNTLRSVIDFIMTVAVVVGVGAIFYGLKLIVDKSNDRENVKNSHIIMSLVGGAALCILWTVVQVMSETVADGNIGESASF